MKKTITIISCLLFGTVAFAGKNGVSELQKEKEMLIGKGIISRGFYLNVGLAFPSQTLNVSKATVKSSSGSEVNAPADLLPNSYSLGLQPNIEIGNQWYFWKNDKIGIGLRVSWFQFGFSSYSFTVNNLGDINPTLFDLRLIKLAPQFTLALADKMALDFAIEFAPTFFVGAATKNTPAVNYVYGTSSLGLLITPGIKFRYQIFAAGFDFGFGSLGYGAAISGTSNTGTSTTNSTYTAAGTANTLYPRIYLGFKF
ncbi:MAG: hypothetical protein SFY32_14420 [Bacteroidota bacterium]|nr:hypothetical protein [Bacteroidota bacterium]